MNLVPMAEVMSCLMRVAKEARIRQLAPSESYISKRMLDVGGDPSGLCRSNNGTFYSICSPLLQRSGGGREISSNPFGGSERGMALKMLICGLLSTVSNAQVFNQAIYWLSRPMGHLRSHYRNSWS